MSPFLHLSSALLLLAAMASPTLSLTCTSQKLTAKYSNCTDLPTLNATVHWTYTAAPKASLAVAFAAAPPNPGGWVAWALNPTGSGMIGAQALIAFKDSNGSVVVKTYNISGYGPISESKLSYDVLNKSAEFSAGVMTILATIAWPPSAAAAEVNQVWQVGATVRNGVPMKHDMAPANVGSKGTLKLGGGGGAPAPSPAAGGSARVLEWGMWLHGGLVLLGVMLFGF